MSTLMKKGLFTALAGLIVLLTTLVSCNDDTLSALFDFCNDDEFAQLYEVRVKLAYPAGIDSLNDLAGIEVTATQAQGGSYTALSDSRGVAILHLEIGVYSFSASASFIVLGTVDS